MGLTAGQFLVATDTTECKSVAISGDVTITSTGASTLTNSPGARLRLGLGDASTYNVGTVAGTLATGNDSRFHTHANSEELDLIPIIDSSTEDGSVITYSSGILIWDTPDGTNKADKVSGAVNGNVAGLDASGNLTDSGIAVVDVMEKVVPSAVNNVALLDATGNVIDSGSLLSAVSGARWTALAGTDSPVYKAFNDSTIISFINWVSGTIYAVNDYVRPYVSLDTGQVFRCIYSSGTPDTDATYHGIDTPGYVVYSTSSYMWRVCKSHCLSTTSDLSSILIPGTPVKYDISGTTYYAIVIYCTSDTVALGGTGFLITDTITNFYYGKPEMVTQIELYAPGPFDGITHKKYVWQRGNGYIVQTHSALITDDTGGYNPKIVLYKNTDYVQRALIVSPTINYAYDLVVSTTGYNIEPTDLDETQYALVKGDYLIPSQEFVGANQDAEDLVINVTVVLE